MKGVCVCVVVPTAGGWGWGEGFLSKVTGQIRKGVWC